MSKSSLKLTGLPRFVLEYTLINCHITEFYSYIDNYEDYFQIARILAKKDKIARVKIDYINNKIYNLAYDKILG
jgi:hypothetical protein